MDHTVGTGPFGPAKLARTLFRRAPFPNFPVPRPDILVLGLTGQQAARVGSEPVMRLESIETKPHTSPIPPKNEHNVTYTMGFCPQLASLASFALGLIHGHDPKKHL